MNENTEAKDDRETGRMPGHASYWLVVRSGRGGMEVLSGSLPDGRRSLPVFSFEKEARMFVCMRGSGDDPEESWRVRESGAGELLSTLHAVLDGVGRVALGPIPENAGLDATNLLSINREEFIDRLQRTSASRQTTGEKPCVPGPGLETGVGSYRGSVRESL